MLGLHSVSENVNDWHYEWSSQLIDVKMPFHIQYQWNLILFLSLLTDIIPYAIRMLFGSLSFWWQLQITNSFHFNSKLWKMQIDYGEVNKMVCSRFILLLSELGESERNKMIFVGKENERRVDLSWNLWIHLPFFIALMRILPFSRYMGCHAAFDPNFFWHVLFDMNSMDY